ncbi:MAG TPA: hypothetical protein VK540_15920 [Polyangiaceae bacterium]|nr:hypothetical protein [Polyangiaceae bacterium]
MPAKPHSPRPTLARSVAEPPPYVDYSTMFNIPVLRIEVPAIEAERQEFDEVFADDDAPRPDADRE